MKLVEAGKIALNEKLKTNIDDIPESWNGSIINSTLLNQAFQVGKLASGKSATVWGVPYDMGCMIDELNGVRYAEHRGFSGTHLSHFQEEDLSIIVLTNLDLRSRSNPRGIAHYLAKDVLK